jgi:phage shock protein C
MAAKKNKRLIKGKSTTLFGVCSGMSDYFGIDVTIIRLGWIIATAFTGFIPGIIAYVIAAFVIPEE